MLRRHVIRVASFTLRTLGSGLGRSVTNGSWVSPTAGNATRPNDAGSLRDAEPALEGLAAGTADLYTRAVLELERVVAAGAAVQRVHQVEPHDHRAVDAHEVLRVEPVLERLHRLADDVPPVASVELGIRAVGDDVVDLIDRDRAHLAAHLDGDPLEVRLRRGGEGEMRGRGATAEHGQQLLAELLHPLRREALASASKRRLEALVVERLDEIVHRGDVER